MSGFTRSSFIARGAVATGTLYGAGAVGSYVTRAFAQSGGAGDIDILNFALTLEYLEAAFYAEAVKGGKLSGEAVKFAKAVAHDEAAHVTFLKTAMALEDTGVSAYAGAAPMIANKKTLAAALSVHSVEEIIGAAPL